MENKDNNTIYYVGLSDGGEKDKMHYVCMSSKNEEETIAWCKAVSLKYPESNQTYIKMTGKFEEEFRKIYNKEYDRLEKQANPKYSSSSNGY